ncbi:MAG: hypothetical protein AB1598_03810 [Thermodesulfobacteriota bacterium]
MSNHYTRDQLRNITDRFERLFTGRRDAWGAVHGECVREPVSQRSYFLHLIGKVSLGVYPLLDNGTCRFGAIDIDRDDLELVHHIREELWNVGLKPTFIERSKSKGYHIWVFFSEPVEARKIRHVLNSVLLKLKVALEVFPKQDYLKEREIGNYINLPYFGGLRNTPERRVILDGKSLTPIPLSEFLRLGKSSLITPDIVEAVLEELPEMPVVSSETNGEILVVNVYSLGISERVRKLIAGDFFRGPDNSLEVKDPGTGEVVSYRSRSEADEAIIASLLSKGYGEDEIVGVFEKYPTTGKYREKGNRKKQYLMKSIENARKFVGNAKRVTTPSFQSEAISKGKDSTVYIPSAILGDGRIAEMVYDPYKKETGFAVFNEGEISYESRLSMGNKLHLSPYSPRNNLIKNEVILFPSGADEYESEEKLIEEIRAFIHDYVDLSPLFENISSYYVLFSWIYDDFKELPYLRVIGDAGSGKTRFLLTLGSLCYKPIFASGASTVSPIFRILNIFKGTLIIDEGDFRMSDEKAEIVKILNNGNAKGFPVLRSESINGKEFSPKAYQVFGPKIVATRGFFEDRALESRCITEEMGQRRLREDIPINLTDEHKERAERLRNKLLMFRFRNLGKRKVNPELVDRTIEPRLNQVFVPLLSVIEDEKTRLDLKSIARDYHKQIVTERGMEMEAQVLECIRSLSESDEEPSIKDITREFIEKYAEDYTRQITPKWIGSVIRKKLKLKTEKTREGFVIPKSEEPKLMRLYEKYGIAEETRMKDTTMFSEAGF